MNHKTIVILIVIIAIIIVGLIIAIILKRRRNLSIEGGDDDYGYMSGLEMDEVSGGKGRFKLRLRDPGYTAALEGKKTVDIRLNKPSLEKLKADAKIIVSRSRPKEDQTEYAGQKRFLAKITHVTPYSTMKALIAGEGLDKITPWIKSDAALVKLYREFIPEEEEKKLGLVAIAWKKL
jgi:ASC-1-like (ASCH) protein